MRMKTLLVAKIEPKTERSYDFVREGRAGNPTSIHNKNYVISLSLKRPQAIIDAIERGDADEIQVLRSELYEAGIHGEVIIKKPLGGPGIRRRGETKAQWLAKRKSGMPEIARFEV